MLTSFVPGAEGSRPAEGFFDPPMSQCSITLVDIRVTKRATAWAVSGNSRLLPMSDRKTRQLKVGHRDAPLTLSRPGAQSIDGMETFIGMAIVGRAVPVRPFNPHFD